jgi:hypothetical protein
MFKELRYFFYILIIITFTFFNVKYYFSDKNKMNSYRTFVLIKEKDINSYKNLPILKNDTNKIIENIEKNFLQNKKKYKFLELLTPNE